MKTATIFDQDTFDMIAHHYDLLYGNRVDDLDMWLTLTDDLNGEILEVGCGTGRVMLPLLQQARRVTGVDISNIALQAARAKLEASDLAEFGSLHQADMRTLSLPQRDFVFAFLPINTFMHCENLVDQTITLTALHDHLRPGGLLVIDLYHPSPHRLLEADGQLVLEDQQVDDLTGNLIHWFVARRLWVDEQIEEVTFILDETKADGTLSRNTLSFSLRYVHRFEMTLLLQQAGFHLHNILGDYDLSPFHAESPRMIFIARV